MSVFPSAEETGRLLRSPDFLNGQFSVALRELEAAAVADANHPGPYTANGLASARRNVFRWLDLWMEAKNTAKEGR